MKLRTIAVLLVVLATTGACAQPSAAEPPGPATFAVTVEGGYGDGAYAPGTVVHVWSDASTTDEVARGWAGDDDLLADPDEWATSFVMPARDVHLVADSQPATSELTVESFTGVTGRAKTVRHHLFETMRGVVVMSHGTGGSSRFIEGTEAHALALGLVHAGFGVIATEAEEVVASDLNGDGKVRWQGGYSATNVDLRNLDALFADLGARGLIPPGTPRFALGMSAGGSFSHRLGTVSSTDAAEAFGHLVFNAVVSYCADATGTLSAPWSTTPSAWYMCGAEDNPEVSNAEARANEAALAARGVPTEYHEHAPTPLYDERFARVDGISAATSAAMADELRDAGFVGADGFLTASGTAIAGAIAADPGAFPATVAQTGSLGALRGQLKAMRAEHTMYADATARTVAFFDRFTDPPSAPFGSWVAMVARLATDLTASDPTPSDLDTWVTALEAGTATPGEVVASLRAGPDNTDNVDPAVRLYRAFLGRTPDADGLEFWVRRRREGGWTLVRTAQHFASSSEFIRRYGELSNRQYVTRLYTDVLGRSPDQGGVDYWTRQLDLGRRSRGSVMVGFSESSEFRRQQVPFTDVAVAHIFLLGRAPSEAAVTEWVDRHHEGASVAELAGELVADPAYAAHIVG